MIDIPRLNYNSYFDVVFIAIIYYYYYYYRILYNYNYTVIMKSTKVQTLGAI